MSVESTPFLVHEWLIVGWITIIVFLCVRLGLLFSTYTVMLQSVLNSAVCMVFGLKRCGHIAPVLMDLHGNIVVCNLRTDWGLRSFAMAGPSCLIVWHLVLKSFSFTLDNNYICKTLETYIFDLV